MFDVSEVHESRVAASRRKVIAASM